MNIKYALSTPYFNHQTQMVMHLKFCSFLLFCLLTTSGSAQLSLTGFGGYTFDDRFDLGGITGRIEGAGHWGVALEYATGAFTGIELLYQRMDTQVPFTWIGIEERRTNLALNYLLLGSTRYLPVSDAIWPYGGGSIGLAISSANDETSTKFAWMVKLGAMFMPKSKVSIKAQAQLSSIVQGLGGGLYFGTGGSGVNINTFSTIYQFGLTGGLVVHFGQRPLPAPAPGSRPRRRG